MVSLIFQMIQSYDLFVIIFNQTDVWKAFRIVFSPNRWLNLVFVRSSFSLLSLPYVVPLLNIFPFTKKRKNLWKVFLIIPYSIIYTPLYTLVGIIGLLTGIWNYQTLEKI
ncbi:MAG: hypothetical protein LBG52_03635 [Candidatus Peribacteria bacterium]|jgi:hypothetical protein|nr:hypothetical protein [Candidatus Peribacteria bacterium]